MTYIEALILGIIQGLTEFLPVSSSGHLELGAHFLKVNTGSNLLFAIVVHGATALSTVVIFRDAIWRIIKGLLEFKWNSETRYAAKIALSMIPVGIVGVFFEDQIEVFFTGKILLVASMLSVTGVLLLLTYYSKNKTGLISFPKSLIIGLSQAVAILPGISRSGATISTALLLGIDRDRAAEFSFLMVLPPILGATLLQIIKYTKAPDAEEAIGVGVLVVGFIAAFLSGLIACRWMIKLVRSGKLLYFAIYCFAVSLLVLILS